MHRARQGGDRPAYRGARGPRGAGAGGGRPPSGEHDRGRGVSKQHLEEPMNRGYPLTLGAIIRRALQQYPDNVALIHEGRRITYRQFSARINQAANALASLGARAGDRIAILTYNCPEFLEVEFAALLGGMSRVGLNARLHPKEHAYIVNDCGASLLFVGEEFAEHIAGTRAELCDVRHIVCVGQGAPGMLDYEAVLAGQPKDEIYVPVDPADPAVFLYTSGTTGRPTGAVLSHRNWIACMRNILVELPPIGERDVMLHVAPLTHASGCLAIPHLARGAANLTVKAFDPGALLSTFQRERVTTALLVPTMINLLAAYPEVRQYDLSSLLTVVYAGSPIAAEKLRQAIQIFGDIFVQFYGLSEVPMPISCLRKEEHLVDGSPAQLARLASAGRPAAFVEVKLVDEEGRPAPTGEMGEVCARGDIVMNG